MPSSFCSLLPFFPSVLTSVPFFCSYSFTSIPYFLFFCMHCVPFSYSHSSFGLLFWSWFVPLFNIYTFSFHELLSFLRFLFSVRSLNSFLGDVFAIACMPSWNKKGAKGEPCFELNSAKWREVGFKNEAVAYFKTLS